MAKTPQHFSLRIPNSIMDKLKYVAEYNGRSANQEIGWLIDIHIAKFEKKYGEIIVPFPEEDGIKNEAE